MNGCVRLYTCPLCQHMLVVRDGKRENEPCDCMLERAAIQAESREAEREFKAKQLREATR